MQEKTLKNIGSIHFPGKESHETLTGTTTAMTSDHQPGIRSNASSVPLVDLVGEHAVVAAAILARVLRARHRADPRRRGKLGVRVESLRTPAFMLELKTEIGEARVDPEALIVADLRASTHPRTSTTRRVRSTKQQKKVNHL